MSNFLNDLDIVRVIKTCILRLSFSFFPVGTFAAFRKKKLTQSTCSQSILRASILAFSGLTTHKVVKLSCVCLCLGVCVCVFVRVS